MEPDDRHPDPRVRFAAKVWLVLLVSTWAASFCHHTLGWP